MDSPTTVSGFWDLCIGCGHPLQHLAAVGIIVAGCGSELQLGTQKAAGNKWVMPPADFWHFLPKGAINSLIGVSQASWQASVSCQLLANES